MNGTKRFSVLGSATSSAIVVCSVILLALVLSGCNSADSEAPAPVAQSAAEPSEVVAPPTALQSPSDSDRKDQGVRDDAVVQAQFEEVPREGAPPRRTTFYRLDASGPARIPEVVLSKGHEALCVVNVGDALPSIELPQIGTNQARKLADLYGKTATVVVFWKGDRRMAREELADLGSDVVELFGDKGVTVVGIAVDETAASAQAVLAKAGARFLNLRDAGGKAFALVGSDKLPRTYLVDPQGKILWFDIEYSPSTRRELHRALHAVTGAPSDPSQTEPAAAQPAE